MGFLTEAQEQTKNIGARPTKLKEIEARLDSKDFKEFLAAMQNQHITCAAISRTLNKRGIKCAPNTLTRMRQGMVANVNK